MIGPKNLALFDCIMRHIDIITDKKQAAEALRYLAADLQNNLDSITYGYEDRPWAKDYVKTLEKFIRLHMHVITRLEGY